MAEGASGRGGAGHAVRAQALTEDTGRARTCRTCLFLHETAAPDRAPTGTGGEAEGSRAIRAWAKIEKAAKALAADGAMTVSEAVDRVLTEQPALYAEYLQREQRAGER